MILEINEISEDSLMLLFLDVGIESFHGLNFWTYFHSWIMVQFLLSFMLLLSRIAYNNI